MNKRLCISLCFAALVCLLAGCAKGEGIGPTDPGSYRNGLPRLVVSGTASNAAGDALAGIAVSLFGVREETEPDILTYNYALTDTAGRYTIIRYRTHELPAEVTLVATDSSGIYREQLLVAPVVYDTVRTEAGGKEPYNGFVTAHFVLYEQ